MLFPDPKTQTNGELLNCVINCWVTRISGISCQWDFADRMWILVSIIIITVTTLITNDADKNWVKWAS